jgi:hypothetical protein
VKICPPKGKWYPKSKVKVDVLNLSNAAKVLDFSKGGVSLGKHLQQALQHSTEFNTS